MLVRLRLRRPGLMAEAAQSIDTFDLVPKKRVVPLFDHYQRPVPLGARLGPPARSSHESELAIFW